jgi:hypothetical protein
MMTGLWQVMAHRRIRLLGAANEVQPPPLIARIEHLAQARQHRYSLLVSAVDVLCQRRDLSKRASRQIMSRQ